MRPAARAAAPEHGTDAALSLRRMARRQTIAWHGRGTIQPHYRGTADAPALPEVARDRARGRAMPMHRPPNTIIYSCSGRA